MANNKLYSALSNVNPRYWRDLQVRYDALKDGQSVEQFKTALSALNVKELNELYSIISSSSSLGEATKEQLIEALCEIDSDKQLLVSLLRDFSNRKKTTIVQYYDLHTEGGVKEYETPIAQLYALFMESPSNLYEIYTFHMWSLKGSGSLLSSESSEKKVQQNKAIKIAKEETFQNKLCDILYKQTGQKNKYRIFSFAEFKDRVILLLFKRVNDTSILDFEENKRNQEVNALIYQINSADQTIEMKAVTVSEAVAIKEHAQLTFGTTFTEHRPEVFRDYDPIAFKDAVLRGTTASGKPVEDFLIDRITFRGSPLKNAPEVTIQLKDMDIWPSVMDAHVKGAVNVTSLKDIGYLSIHSAGTSRTIRSIIRDNGNIVFSMDDSRMDAATKEHISRKFMEKFDVPLFQEITNDKFAAGKADLINYVLTQSSPDGIREPEEERTMKELEEAGLLSITKEYRIECLNVECDYQDKVPTEDFRLEECPKCKEQDFNVRTQRLLQADMKNIASAASNQLEYLCIDQEWKILKESTRKFGNHQYVFHNYERNLDGKPLQVLITDQVIPSRVVKQLIKQMTPLFVIFVGKQEKDIESYNQECIQAMTFGEVYAIDSENAKEHFNKLYADLELRSKNFIAMAAYEANVSIERNVGIDPTQISSAYNDTEFEDDVYCLLKDIFVNTVKWGQEMKGKPVPEGVFSISFRKKRGSNLVGFKYAVSYDCKLTRKADGYDLGKSEQRKAVEYVNTLNDSDYIMSYATDNQLTAHVFISNKLRSAQIEGMIRYFHEQLGTDYSAVPVFIEAELLIELHSWYRRNEETLRQAPNNFMSQFYDLFKTPGLITRDRMERMSEKALDPSLRELEFLDMSKLSKDITN